ncbi:MAG: metal ABC transporter permease [Candidatus Saccharibacteria bacterium]
MNLWYSLVNYILPFQWLEFDFMKNALLALVLVSPIFGLAGAMVVNNRMAFFSDAIGHAALTGIAIGVILGLGSPLWAMLAFSILLAILISWAHIKTEASPDTVIGVFFAAAVALGIVILSRQGGFNKYSKYLIGDLLSITPGEIALLFVVLLVVMALWMLVFNKLFLVSFNPAVARSRRINTFAMETAFAVVIAMVVTVSIQWVGILVINSLLILPAAAARNISGSMRAYSLTAVLISFISGIAGLILSYYWETATGATIVLCAFACYAATVLVKGIRN